MHEKICDIQNAFWKAYKDFSETKDMRKYNNDVDALIEKYRHDGILLNFCQNLALTWTPVINGIKEWS